MKYTRAKPREDGSLASVDLVIPAFGYKNHVSIDHAFGLIRRWTTTNAAAHDGARLEDVSDRKYGQRRVGEPSRRYRRAQLDGMANGGDTAYRSAKNEEMLARRGFVSRLNRRSTRPTPPLTPNQIGALVGIQL